MNEVTSITYMISGMMVGFMIAVICRMFKSTKSTKSVFDHHNHNME